MYRAAGATVAREYATWNDDPPPDRADGFASAAFPFAT
jgi:hypothetical protein